MSEIDSSPIRKVNIKTTLIITFSVIGLAVIIITLMFLFSNLETNGGDS